MNSLGRGDKNNDKNKAALITRETVGMTLILFGAVIFFIAVTGRFVFGDPGMAITAFFLGVFGLFFYPLDLLLIYLGVTLVSGKKFVSVKWILRGLFLVVSVFFIVHVATAEQYFANGYGGYLAGCWTAASESVGSGTGGGVVFGLIAFPVRFLLSAPGAYVLFSLLTALSIVLIFLATPLKPHITGLFHRAPRAKREEKEEERRPVAFDDLSVPVSRTMADEPAPAPQPAPVPVAPAVPTLKDESREILFGGDPASSYRNNLIFNRDSQFNQPRRGRGLGNVEDTRESEPKQTFTSYNAPKPDYSLSASSEYTAPAPSYTAPRPAPQPESAAPSYSERYAAQTEFERPQAPRRITPAEPFAEEEKFTQTPSYRAPSAPAPEKTDFYAHDVAPAVEPTVADEPTETPAAVESPAELAVPVRETRFTPAEEPERFSRDSFLAEREASRFERFREENAEEDKQEPEEEQPSRTSEEMFRSIFSRPVERTDRAVIEPREVTPRETDMRDFGARDIVSREPLGEPQEEEKPEPRTEARFGFGRDAEEESGDRFARRSSADLFEDDEPEIDDADYREEPSVDFTRGRTYTERAPRERTSYLERSMPSVSATPDAPAPQPKRHIYKEYRRPSNSLFAHYDDTVTVSQEEIERNSSIIVETLAGFRVDAEVVKVRSGSAVTRYDIDIPKNIAVRTVIKRDAEIAMRLHARDGVNIYSNSEVGAISIEVPNSKRATVGLRSVMEAEEYVNAKPNSLMFAIGKDIEGRNVCGNVVKMKHILVAGSTGSGKSVALNAMLISLICRYSPEELRLILIDPKKVEFAIFDGLPHLMINEIIADAQKAVSALNWAIKEMERRYSLFEQMTRSGINVHNVDEYNASLSEDDEKLPKIVIVVDELADLMSVAKKDIEDRIQRLAQKARAAGMHLVIATQRPSVDVITGVIKGNLPTRLAFRVIQEVDSRTILDESGAEKLLGNGDMLYRTEGMFNCLRVQGAFLSSAEVQAVIEDIKANNEAYFDESVADYINKNNQTESGGSFDGDDDGAVDPQYIKALAIVVKLGSASISLIQRKCSVGYNHAGKIMEWMELMGYVSAFDGKAKARTVLLTKEEFESKYGGLD